VHWPGAVLTTIFDGQLIVGGWPPVLTTTTLNVQTLVLPDES